MTDNPRVLRVAVFDPTYCDWQAPSRCGTPVKQVKSGKKKGRPRSAKQCSSAASPGGSEDELDSSLTAYLDANTGYRGHVVEYDVKW